MRRRKFWFLRREFLQPRHGLVVFPPSDELPDRGEFGGAAAKMLGSRCGSHQGCGRKESNQRKASAARKFWGLARRKKGAYQKPHDQPSDVRRVADAWNSRTENQVVTNKAAQAPDHAFVDSQVR